MRREQNNSQRGMRTPLLAMALITATFAAPISPGAHAVRQSPSAARLILIVVMDGLRPDSINQEDTPTLFR
ncbi:MAG TPA: hypothetical protein VN743_13385, partial [Blastocatellia bacterium]|nr:hypothetical protein [Blastocatellia bacterium]